MTLRTALGLAPRIQGTRVGRSWRQRIEDLDACGVDYAGKTVVDAGRNVGILAYEISKRGVRPSSTRSTDPPKCSLRPS